MTLAPVERIHADVVIVGSGFSGALVALALRQMGRTVVLLERGRHPRFAIGESSTPLANLLLEELADRYNLPAIRPFSKWATWQATYPHVACGLKRGFTFLFHEDGRPFSDTDVHDRQLMVAASPHDAVGDTHWYRPDFDAELVRQAQEAGAHYFDETAIDTLSRHGDLIVLDATRQGRTLRVRSPFVVDASGPRGFMHHALGLSEAPLRWLPHTAGLFTHFEGVDRWDTLPGAADASGSPQPPYPPDDAALHHVFEGGWIWVLRFNNGITSAGAALTAPLAETIGAANGAPAWERLLDRLPSVREQFAQARATLPFVYSPRLAYRSARVSGPGWTLLPSAAGIIDPLLSSGFPLTLLGVLRVLSVLEHTAPGAERDAAFRAHEATTLAELDATEHLVAALYATMADPPLFKRLALMYFAAASYSEAARRLDRPHLAPGFLLHRHPRFGPELTECVQEASAKPTGHDRASLLARIALAVEPFDIAGLLDCARHDWFPVRANDILGHAAKLESTTEEVERMLARCGFVST